MRVDQLKKILEQYNDEDVVVVDVHDTILSEDLYGFRVDDVKLDDRKEIRICPVDHSESGKRFGLMWCTDDIRSLGYICTEKQAEEVLESVVEHHDASVGVNWDVIEEWCQYHKLKRKTRMFSTTVKYKDGQVKENYIVMVGHNDLHSVPSELDDLIFYYFEDMDEFDSYLGLPEDEPNDGEFIITEYAEI